MTDYFEKNAGWLITIVITAISGLVSGFKAYNALDNRILLIEEKAKDMERRVAGVETTQAEDLKEIRRALNEQREASVQVMLQLSNIQGQLEGYKEGKEHFNKK